MWIEWEGIRLKDCHYCNAHCQTIHCRRKVRKMIVCRLEDILTECGMSRRELARRSGLNINTVCKMANDDHRMIDLTILDQVCEVLQIQPGELLVRETE